MDQSSESNRAMDLVGRRLGDYEILRRLGKGGMAEVFLAEQCSLGRKVALKVLRAELAADENYVRRFQNEARAVASLVHAHIVQIYEVGCVDGIHFLAQEYVSGQTLKQLVSRRGALDVPTAMSILRQVASALCRASQQKMVHRDIKPENILLNSEGEAKVADFGLARVISDDKADMTQIGMTMGTPLYMSPEQVEGRPLDPRSDIYSFGVTAFYMLAGHPPFQGDTPLNIAIQHLQATPPDLREIRDDLPDELVRIINKMLAKNPDDRYASATILLRDLRGIHIEGLGEFPVDDSFDVPHSATTSPHLLDATIELQSVMTQQTAMLKKQKKNRSFVPLALFMAAVLGGLAAWLTWPGPILARSNSTTVAKQETPQAQWIYASRLNTESAWKSVAEYYPATENSTNAYWCRSAKQHLANLYVLQERYEEAYKLYGELAALKQIEPEFAAIGLAGQAIIHHLQGDKQKKLQKVAEVYPLRNRIRDEELRREIESFAEQLGIKDQLDRASTPE